MSIGSELEISELLLEKQYYIKVSVPTCFFASQFELQNPMGASRYIWLDTVEGYLTFLTLPICF